MARDLLVQHIQARADLLTKGGLQGGLRIGKLLGASKDSKGSTRTGVFRGGGLKGIFPTYGRQLPGALRG